MTITELKLYINDLIDSNTDDFSDARKIRSLNVAQNKVVNKIIQSDKLFQWDDENYTDLNEGYIDIVSGTNDYNLKEDENFAGLLFIGKVFIKENATDSFVEIDYKEYNPPSTTNGTPNEYRISGKTIVFNPTFDYSLTDGIKVQFIRTPKPITALDTTKKIGIPETYHHLVALYVCYDYARAKNLANKNDFLNDILLEEKKLGLYIDRLNNPINSRIVPEEINSI